MFKRILTICICCFLLLGCKPAIAETLPVLTKQAVFTADCNTVSVDGQSYTVDACPFIEKDRIFLPLRFVGEVMGASVDWQNSEAVLNISGKTLILKQDELFLNNNGKYELMDVTPVIVPPGRVCLPARYVCEAAGYKVNWNQNERSMTIFRG